MGGFWGARDVQRFCDGWDRVYGLSGLGSVGRGGALGSVARAIVG